TTDDQERVDREAGASLNCAPREPACPPRVMCRAVPPGCRDRPIPLGHFMLGRKHFWMAALVLVAGACTRPAAGSGPSSGAPPTFAPAATTPVGESVTTAPAAGADPTSTTSSPSTSSSTAVPP